MKSCYKKLERLLVWEKFGNDEKNKVYEGIKAPSKVVVFSWKLFLDGIPTRRNLARQNCLPQMS